MKELSHRIRETSLLLIILFGTVLRLWFLGTIPTGLSNDEAGYMYSSYSIWHTGKDVAGKFLPLSINLDNSFSPVYIYATAPSVGLLGLSPFAGRLPFALISIACIPIMYLVVKELLGNRSIALLSTLLLAISPWHIMASRAALDADFALFFYLLGIYLFIRYRKSSHYLWSLVPFLLGFYSYHATKIFFLFLVLTLLLYYFKDIVAKKKNATLFITGVVAILISFSIISTSQSVSRQQVLLGNDTASMATSVNHDRQYSTAPEILKPIFSNKGLLYLQSFRNYYLEAFSPQFLFLYGEPSGLKKQFSLMRDGQFYLIESVLLLAGLYFFFKKKLNKLVLLLLLISPLPSAVSSDQSYVNRSTMMIPWILTLVAIGIYYLFKSSKKYQKLFSVGIAAIYILSFANFLYMYFFLFPAQSSEAWFEQSKTIATFAHEQQKSYDHIFISEAGKMFLLQYGIYNHIDPTTISAAWEAYPHAKIGNVHFVEDDCTEEMPITYYNYPKNSLLIAPGNCYQETKPIHSVVNKGEVLHVLWKVIKIEK